MEVRIKRIYEAPSADDGDRILVDRLWPRGVRKGTAELDLWMKDVAPSTELRVWWQHDPARFEEFAERYRLELMHSKAIGELESRCREHAVVTLLYAARDPACNHALVLHEMLTERLG